MLKNTDSQKIGAQLVKKTDGTAITTGTVTVYISIDGTYSTSSTTVNHQSNGYWTYSPTQGQTNGNLIAFTFTHTDAIPATVQVFTRDKTTMPVNVQQFGGTDGTFTAGKPSVQDVEGDIFGDVQGGVLGNVTGTVAGVDTTVNANVVQLAGDTQSATDLKDFVDSGYDPVTHEVLLVGYVTSVASLDTGAIVAGSFAANAITNAAFANSVLTSAEVPQLAYLTGDAYARLGAPAGASIAADIAAISAGVETEITDRLPSATAKTNLDKYFDGTGYIDASNINWPRIIYVAVSGGDDANDGFSRDLPKATVTSAISAANPGDTVWLLPGEHTVRAVVNKAITLRGESTTTSKIITSHATSSIQVTTAGVVIRDLFAVNEGAGAAIKINSNIYNTEIIRIDGDSYGAPCFDASSTTGTKIIDCVPASHGSSTIDLSDSDSFVVNGGYHSGGGYFTGSGDSADPANWNIDQNKCVIRAERAAGTISNCTLVISQNVYYDTRVNPAIPHYVSGDQIGLAACTDTNEASVKLDNVRIEITQVAAQSTGAAIGISGSLDRTLPACAMCVGGVISAVSVGSGEAIEIEASIENSAVHLHGTRFSRTNSTGNVQITGDALGPGAVHVTLTFHVEGSGDPIQAASVWITSDQSGSFLVAGAKETNSEGKVTFLLDDGITYYAWLRKDGIEPILGYEFIAVSD